jgi:hypothetical protein
MEMLLENETRKKIFNTPAQVVAHVRLEWREICFLSLPLVALSIFLQIFTGTITTALSSGGPLKDAILSLIPPIDLSLYFVWGYITMISAFALYVILVDIRKFRGAAFYFSLIVIVRAGFILLTGLRSPEGSLPVSFPGFTGHLQAENDLFFSGHTAIPFMAYLYFKDQCGDKKFLRWFFLFGSFSLGATALIMHRHYSIDVASAPFISFGVYTIGKHLYARLRPVFEPKRAENENTAGGRE